jgi:hypothetical protein
MINLKAFFIPKCSGPDLNVKQKKLTNYTVHLRPVANKGGKVAI